MRWIQVIEAADARGAGPVAALAGAVRRVGAYLLAGFAAAAALAILIASAPDPASSGLVPVAMERISIMAPGEQHQARNPASASWSLGFADQFRFGAETERQRAAIADRQVAGTEERQWHFNLTAPESRGRPLALFIPNAAGDLTLHVNSVRIANSDSQPAYFGPGIGGSMLAAALPQRDLNLDLNRISVIQSADAAHIGIRAFYLGPVAAVGTARVRFERWLEWQRLGAAIGAAAGIIAIALLLMSGQQRVPVAALALLSATQLLCLGEFGARLLPPWAAPGLTALACGAIALCHCRPRDWTASLVLGLAVVGLLGAAAGLALALGTWLPPAPFLLLELANDGPRPLLLLGAPALVWREGKAMIDRLRQARHELLHKDRIIARQQQALDAEIRNAAVLEERQRFARDMHDGIGGHLQSLLMRVRADRIPAGEIASELQSGLADLRLMVDSLDQLDTSLDFALENFRLRAGPQLDAAGIALNWRVDGLVGTVSLDPRATLSVYRILQEIVTNCVRHSGATQLRVAIGFDRATGLLTVAIGDDGCGFDPAAVKAGKGLTNLRQRATKLGGSLSVTSGSRGAGTQIAFQLPVSAARS